MISNEPTLQAGATLYIDDNGQDIPKSEQEKIFGRGYRGEAVQDTIDSSGLGLAIAREMVMCVGGMTDLLDDGPSKLDGKTVCIISC